MQPRFVLNMQEKGIFAEQNDIGLMKVTLYQQDIVWDNPQANRLHIERMMAQSETSDMFVMPEMFSTGFATQPEGIAEQEPSETLSWMQETAIQNGVALAGSVAIQSDGKFYNRFYFVKPDGSEVHYDKHHLFTYGGEDKQFTAGQERVVVEYGGIRFLLQVCYDLRFPVFSRNKGDYDVAIYVASWPVTRVKAWSQLLRARAIENQCYVIGVNRTGTDPVCQYNGGSAVISPYGETIAECEWGTEMTCCADIDMDVLYNFRKKFPVLNDADGFQLT